MKARLAVENYLFRKATSSEKAALGKKCNYTEKVGVLKKSEDVAY